MTAARDGDALGDPITLDDDIIGEDAALNALFLAGIGAPAVAVSNLAVHGGRSVDRSLAHHV